MPELIVTPTSFARHCVAWLGILLLLCAMPTPIDSHCSAVHAAKVECGYDPATPIDAKIAGEFVTYWAGMAFDYAPKTMQSNHEKASKWNSCDALTCQLNQTFWTKDTATRPTRWERYRLTRVNVLGKDTAGVSVDTIFAWNKVGLKKAPMSLHFVVKKCADGYRMHSVQVDFYNKSGYRASLVQSDISSLYYWNGKECILASYKTAVDSIKPEIDNQRTFDHVFFTWCKGALNEQKGSKNQLI